MIYATLSELRARYPRIPTEYDAEIERQLRKATDDIDTILGTTFDIAYSKLKNICIDLAAAAIFSIIYEGNTERLAVWVTDIRERARTELQEIREKGYFFSDGQKILIRQLEFQPLASDEKRYSTMRPFEVWNDIDPAEGIFGAVL